MSVYNVRFFRYAPVRFATGFTPLDICFLFSLCCLKGLSNGVNSFWKQSFTTVNSLVFKTSHASNLNIIVQTRLYGQTLFILVLCKAEVYHLLALFLILYCTVLLYWKRDKFIHFVVHYYFGLKPWITLFYFIHDLKSVAINIVQFEPFRSIIFIKRVP